MIICVVLRHAASRRNPGRCYRPARLLALIVEGNLEIGAHNMWTEVDNLNCFRTFLRSTGCLFSFIRAQRALSYYLI